jgi:hypothetical protein
VILKACGFRVASSLGRQSVANGKDKRHIGRIQADLLKLVRETLHNAGLHDLDLHSIQLRVRHLPECPHGTEPVFECTAKADGTIVCEWVCK